MATDGVQFSYLWNGGTISLKLGVIWEMSVQIHFLEMGLHSVVSHAPPLMSTRKNRIPVNGAQNKQDDEKAFG